MPFALALAGAVLWSIKGPARGAAMRAAEEAWIAAGFPGEQAALAAIADVAIKGA